MLLRFPWGKRQLGKKRINDPRVHFVFKHKFPKKVEKKLGDFFKGKTKKMTQSNLKMLFGLK